MKSTRGNFVNLCIPNIDRSLTGISCAGPVSLKLTTSGSTTAGSTDYSVTCKATVYASTSITWKNPDGTVIFTSSDFTVGGVTGSVPTYSLELMFNCLKTSQAGVYTCSAPLDSKNLKSTTPVSVISMLYIYTHLYIPCLNSYISLLQFPLHQLL